MHDVGYWGLATHGFKPIGLKHWDDDRKALETYVTNVVGKLRKGSSSSTLAKTIACNAVNMPRFAGFARCAPRTRSGPTGRGLSSRSDDRRSGRRRGIPGELMGVSNPQLSQQQASPLSVAGTSVALSAGAGCGKTTVLTARFLGDLEGPTAYPLSLGHCADIHGKGRPGTPSAAFANSAGSGSKPERIPSNGAAILRGLEAAPIGTFHEFCGHWLRRHALEAGIDPDFTIFDVSVAGDS